MVKKPTQRGLSQEEIKERGMEPLVWNDAASSLLDVVAPLPENEPSAPVMSIGAMNNVPVKWDGFDIQKTPSMGKVDKRLVRIINETAKEFPLRTSVYSGWRSKSWSHSNGRAIDIVLYDQLGKKLPNYQDTAMWRIYELFGQKSKFIQMRLYPELNSTYEWGGYFGDNGKWKFKYGSCDLMHYNIDPRGSSAYRAGSLRKGLVGYYKDFYAKNSIIGPSKPMTTEEELDKEIYEKLNSFVLPSWFKPTYYPSVAPIPDKEPISNMASTSISTRRTIELTNPSELKIINVLAFSLSEKSLTVRMSNGNSVKRIGGSLSWRYNNPGNLKYGSFAKNNGSIGSGWKDHAVFDSFNSGKLAQKELLFGSDTVYNRLSILDSIKRYAPSSDGNEPLKYATFISRRIGMPINSILSSLNEEQKEKMIESMIVYEGYSEGRIIAL